MSQDRPGGFPGLPMEVLKMNKQIVAGLAAVGVLVVSTAANAAGAVDVTPITSAFTAADIVTGVMSVAGTLAVVYVSIKAAKIVLGMLRGS